MMIGDMLRQKLVNIAQCSIDVTYGILPKRLDGQLVKSPRAGNVGYIAAISETERHSMLAAASSVFEIRF
jgi:hypothetical protein